jgi:hypothetical protein
LGPQLEQLKPQDVAVPWPNDAWNSWKPGNDFAGEFVHINAIRTGPDGILWAVDAGAPGFGQPAIHGAARLIGFDTSTGQLERVYSLSAGAKPTRSGLDIQDVDRSKASNQRSSLNVVLHRLAQPNPND